MIACLDCRDRNQCADGAKVVSGSVVHGCKRLILSGGFPPQLPPFAGCEGDARSGLTGLTLRRENLVDP